MALRTLSPFGPFSLASASRFLCTFTPAAGSACEVDDGLGLSFLSDRTFQPVAARVTQDGDEVRIDAFGGDPDAIARQAARILSLDWDARPLATIARRDPVVRAALERRVGFRPPIFPSPYEAALWGVLSQRTPMRVAAAVKRKLAETHGERVPTPWGDVAVVPSPAKLLSLDAAPGIAAEKLRRLHAVAEAALEGRLDAERLRAMAPDEALDDLASIRGIGPWTAQHVLMRGTGPTDTLPTAEPRVAHAIELAYGLRRTPSLDEIADLAERWRPFRMWICVLFVAEFGFRDEVTRTLRSSRPPAPRRSASASLHR